MDSMASMRSNSSHQPVLLTQLAHPGQGLRCHERSQDLRRRARHCLPPRFESTQPRDTSPELSSGKETAGEFKVGELQSRPRHHASRTRWDTSADDEDEDDGDDGEWVDEDIGIEGVAVLQMTCCSSNSIRTMLAILRSPSSLCKYSSYSCLR